MYFLHDAHHGTVFPISWFLGWKWKQGRARTILDSATHSISWQRFLELFVFADKLNVKKSNIRRTRPTLTALLHLFLDFSAENGNEDIPIQDYFGFNHALHLLAAVFRNSFSLRRIVDLLALQAAHTDAPCENCWQLPSAAIPSAVFFSRSRPWNHQQNKQQNKCLSEQDVYQVYIPQCTVNNVKTKTMVTPCQKSARHVFMFSSDQY